MSLASVAGHPHGCDERFVEDGTSHVAGLLRLRPKEQPGTTNIPGMAAPPSQLVNDLVVCTGGCLWANRPQGPE